MREKIFIVLLFIILVNLGLVSSIVPTFPSCSDSDNGIVIYTKGTVSPNLGALVPTYFTDHCTSPTILKEYYCDFFEVADETVTCEFGCQNGACKKVGCGDTLMKNLTMSEHLQNSTGGTICPGDGLIIGADNIVLDCNNHKITGKGFNPGISIVENIGNIQVKNCKIYNFGYGISIAGRRPETALITLNNNIIKDISESGISIPTHPANDLNDPQYGILKILDNIIYCGDKYGIKISNRQTIVGGQKYTEDEVRGNLIFDNVIGIWFFDSHGASFYDNVIVNNDYGISDSCSDPGSIWVMQSTNCSGTSSLFSYNYFDNPSEFQITSHGVQPNSYANYWADQADAENYDTSYGTVDFPDQTNLPQDIKDKIAIANIVTDCGEIPPMPVCPQIEISCDDGNDNDCDGDIDCEDDDCNTVCCAACNDCGEGLFNGCDATECLNELGQNLGFCDFYDRVLVNTCAPNATKCGEAAAKDTDNDGLLDTEEAVFGTDPEDFDTDNDGLTDYEEVIGGTNATNADSDGDGLDDKSDPNPNDEDVVQNTLTDSCYKINDDYFWVLNNQFIEVENNCLQTIDDKDVTCCPRGKTCEECDENFECIFSGTIRCSDYKTESQCNSYDSNIAAYNIEEELELGIDFCQNALIECKCIWKVDKCEPKYELFTETDDGPVSQASCSYDSDESECRAGIKTISYTSTIESSGTCQVPSQIMASCNVPTEIPFTGLYSLTMAAGLIILIYFLKKKFD